MARSLPILLVLLLAASDAVGADVDRRGDPLPRGAVLRLGTIRDRHPSDARPDRTPNPDLAEGERERLRYPSLVARAPDGKAATGGEWGVVRLWGRDGDLPLRSFLGHEEEITALAFLDGGRLASASGDLSVRLWDLESGREVWQALVSDGPILHLRLTEDRKALLADGDLAFTRIDVATGRLLDPDAGHLRGVEFAALAPDGRLAASASGGRTVLLWDLESGRVRRILRGHVGSVTGLAFSPRGSLLVSTDIVGAVLFWNPETGARRRAAGRHYMRAFRPAFTAGGDALVTGGTWGRLKIWDPASGQWIGWILAHGNEDWAKQEVRAVACSPDGATVASAARDEVVELRRYHDGSLVSRTSEVPSPEHLSYAPDGREIAVASRSGSVTVLSLTDLAKVRERAAAFTTIAWMPGGGLLAAGDSAGVLHLLKAADLTTVARVPAHAGTVTALAVAPDGRRILTGSADGTLLVFDTEALLGHAPGAPVRVSPVPAPVEVEESRPPVAGRAVGLGPGESIRPYGGFVPGAAPAEHESILVVSGTTGRPIAGAKVLRHLEPDPGPPGILLEGAVTDRFGIAWLTCEGRSGREQWLIDADGYAPQCELRRELPPMTVLFPGGDYRGRLLDPFGRPVAGAEVELFVGCGHSPAIRRTVTDGAGLFGLPHVNPHQGRTLWFTKRGIASEYVTAWALFRSGAAVTDFVARPGLTMRFRVIEPDGTPVLGCSLKSDQSRRGPWATSGADGRCRMVGLEPDVDVYVYDPDPDGSFVGTIRTHPWFARDIERVVVRPEIGRNSEDFESRHLVDVPLRILEAGTGTPVPDVSATLVGTKTGWRYDSEELDEDEGDPGRRLIEAPEGRYRLAAGGPFESHMGEPVEVDVRRNPAAPLVARVRPNARLEIRGGEDLPADLRLVVPLGSLPVDEDEPVWLPRSGPAALHWEEEGRVRLVAVDPEKDGVRAVRMQDKVRDAEEETSAELVPETVVLRQGDGSPAPGAEVILWTDDLTGVAEARAARQADAGGRAWIERERGTRALVQARRPDHVPLLAPLGDEVRWGTGRLTLEVVDADGDPVSFGAWVAGTVSTSDSGRLVLAGLRSGRHTVLVGSPYHHSQRLELDVPASGSRSVRVFLPER